MVEVWGMKGWMGVAMTWLVMLLVCISVIFSLSDTLSKQTQEAKYLGNKSVFFLMTRKTLTCFL